MPAVVVQQPRAKRGIGGALAGAVDGRVDPVAAHVGFFAQLFLERGTHHLRRVGCFHLHVEAVPFRGDRCGDRDRVHIGVDEPELPHASEHVVATGERTLRVDDRIEARRSLGQSGEHRDLGKIEFVERTTVVEPGRGAHSIGAMAEEDLVEVELEDLLLAEEPLNLQGEQDLLELALVGLFPAEKEVSRHLHRHRAASRALLPGADQMRNGADEPLPVDAGMLEEALVLRGDDRLNHRRRHFVETQRDPALLAELRHEAPVPSVDAERRLEMNVLQHVDRREFRREQPEHEGEPARAQHADQEPRQQEELEEELEPGQGVRLPATFGEPESTVSRTKSNPSSRCREAGTFHNRNPFTLAGAGGRRHSPLSRRPSPLGGEGLQHAPA